MIATRIGMIIKISQFIDCFIQLITPTVVELFGINKNKLRACLGRLDIIYRRGQSSIIYVPKYWWGLKLAVGTHKSTIGGFKFDSSVMELPCICI